MTDSVTVLIAAGIIIPIVILLIYAAFRVFFYSARNLKEVIEGELARGGKPHADPHSAGKVFNRSIAPGRQRSPANQQILSRTI